jgi:hypothetical protein
MAKMNLHQLEVEAERLVALLKDRQPGLPSWRTAFDRTIKAIIDETGYHDYKPESSTPPLNQRLFDLVRFMRAELHGAELITDEEFLMLAKETGAVKRLEDYDAVIQLRNAGVPCPRCGKGRDTNGDGDCPVCAHLSPEAAGILRAK